MSALDSPPHDETRSRLVAPECAWLGVGAMVVVVIAIMSVSPLLRYKMYWTGDAPFFYAVARHPFASGGVSTHPLVFGNAYRYGRIMYPLTAWLLALGRPALVPGTLLGVYIASVGAWIALAAEHLRRNGRAPALALLLFLLPFSLHGFFRPQTVSDAMAGALVLLVYLYEREHRTNAACIAGALLILTREPMALALAPLVWIAWKERRFVAVRKWMLAFVPYALWLVWVRFRTGGWTFLDPGGRGAISAPFFGYLRGWPRGADGGQLIGMTLALATLVFAVFVATRGHWRYPLTHGALALAALIPFLGIAVFRHATEAYRVLAPIQALLLIAALDRGGRPAADPPVADRPVVGSTPVLVSR